MGFLSERVMEWLNMIEGKHLKERKIVVVATLLWVFLFWFSVEKLERSRR